METCDLGDGLGNRTDATVEAEQISSRQSTVSWFVGGLSVDSFVFECMCVLIYGS